MDGISAKKFGNKYRLGSVSVPAEAAIHILIGFFALACIIPFIFTIIISFSSSKSLSEIGYSFIPKELSTESYQYVFKTADVVFRSFFNSIFVSVVGTVLSMLVTILYSYALYRRDFKYRNFFMFLSFFTMLFGGGLAPTYMICKNMLGLDNNYAALIVPLLFSPFFIIIMRTFFQSSVPEAIIESASIDGSGEYRTLFQIVLPISLPGIATLSLLTMLGYWNDWFLALLYLKPNSQFIPLQYLLVQMQRTAEFMARNSSVLGTQAAEVAKQLPRDSLRMALVVIIVVPIAFAYPFFQRYIISGLTIGAVKG